MSHWPQTFQLVSWGGGCRVGEEVRATAVNEPHRPKKPPFPREPCLRIKSCLGRWRQLDLALLMASRYRLVRHPPAPRGLKYFELVPPHLPRRSPRSRHLLDYEYRLDSFFRVRSRQSRFLSSVSIITGVAPGRK